MLIPQLLLPEWFVVGGVQLPPKATVLLHPGNALPCVPHSSVSLPLPGLPDTLHIHLSADSVLAFPRCLCGSEPSFSARTTASGLLFLSPPFSHLPISGSPFLFMCHFSYHMPFPPVRGLDNCLSSVISIIVGNYLRKRVRTRGHLRNHVV